MTEEKAKNNYEISFLLPQEESLSEIINIISKYKGEISKEQNSLKKIALAYKIKKYNEAYFGFFEFSSVPESLEGISKELTLNKEIIRFLISSPCLKQEASSPSERKPKTEKTFKNDSVNEEDNSSESKSKTSPTSLSNEALEKKLEEILS